MSPSHFLVTHFNIILPSTPRPSKTTIFLKSPVQNYLWISPVPLRATYLTHLISLHLVTSITFSEQYTLLTSSQTNTCRWSFLSVRYPKRHARTTSTVLQAAHCHWRCPYNLCIVLLTVREFVVLILKLVLPKAIHPVARLQVNID